MIDVLPTSREPMRSFVDRMFAIERDDPRVLSLSLIHGFMAGDVPEMGTRMLVVTDGDKARGDALAEKLGREVFGFRGQAFPPMLTPEEAVARVRVAPKKPVVIADVWDNPGGGVAGDATVLLRALLDAGVATAALAPMTAGEGARLPLRFGAKSAPGCGDPIDAEVLVKRIARSATMTFGAMVVPLGDCALIEIGGVEVVLTTLRAQTYERTMFSALGIDPLDKDVLVVKSTNHFHADFARFAGEILYCRAGNPYPSDPRVTAYRKAPREIWPIVDDPWSRNPGSAVTSLGSSAVI
jgi:microcystin degradation protein MlrC